VQDQACVRTISDVVVSNLYYRHYGQCDLKMQSFSQGTGLLLDEWTIEIVLVLFVIESKNEN